MPAIEKYVEQLRQAYEGNSDDDLIERQVSIWRSTADHNALLWEILTQLVAIRAALEGTGKTAGR